ncbi:hypothetical protein EB73_25660 [Mycobacterium sp. SWH-M3]|nr:hypothetical protein EB73_25660 [Mycobacterium sp. SWH-M3]
MTQRNTPDSSAQGGNGAEAQPDNNGVVIDLPVNYGKASTNGHATADGDRNRFGPYAKRPAQLAEDDQYGSPEPANVVGGVYAAEHGVASGKLKRDAAGYVTVAALGGVQTADAKAAGLFDHNPSDADVGRWYSDHGLVWEPPNGATVDRAGLKAAIKGIDPHRKIALATIDTLAAEGVPWAVKAVARAAADNLDASVKGAPYSFTLAELHTHYDVTADDAVGLAPMTTETRLASLRLLREWAAEEYLRAQDTARKRFAAATATVIELPPVMSLDALLAEDDDPVRMRIEQVWPMGGSKGSLAAPAGAGKTTFNGNLIRSLADGEPFLDAFEVHPTDMPVRIAVIDLEMNTSMMRRWLRRQGVRNTAAVVDVVNLRGNPGLFDMGNDRLRDMWARRLRDQGINFVTFDCLKPVIDIMGLNENTEMGKFLTPFDVMLTEAGVPDVLVYHHTGHANGPAGERARGDSSLLGWTDVNLKLIRDDNDDRYFAAAKVRDAEEPAPEGLLSFDKATGRLTYAGGNRAATAKDDTLEQRINEVRAVLVDRHAEDRTDDAGMTKTELKLAVGGNKSITAQAIDAAEKRQLVIVEKAKKGTGLLYRIAPKALDPAYLGEFDNDAAPVDGPAARGAAWPNGE